MKQNLIQFCKGLALAAAMSVGAYLEMRFNLWASFIEITWSVS